MAAGVSSATVTYLELGSPSRRSAARPMRARRLHRARRPRLRAACRLTVRRSRRREKRHGVRRRLDPSSRQQDLGPYLIKCSSVCRPSIHVQPVSSRAASSSSATRICLVTPRTACVTFNSIECHVARSQEDSRRAPEPRPIVGHADRWTGTVPVIADRMAIDGRGEPFESCLAKRAGQCGVPAHTGLRALHLESCSRVPPAAPFAARPARRFRRP